MAQPSIPAPTKNQDQDLEDDVTFLLGRFRGRS